MGIHLSQKISLYLSQIENAKESIEEVIEKLLPFLVGFTNTIFITGIGKSALIARKTVATWQSLGIRTHSILIQDLFHGDLGILQEGDVIFYISNSGNTHELLCATKYIKDKMKVRQICISNNSLGEISNTVDEHYMICKTKIIEVDSFNCVPTTSSVIFMMFFDLLGISISEKRGMTQEQFKINHPGGDIGKYI